MNTIRTVMEPWDASLVANELEKSLNEMTRSLIALQSQSDSGEVMSTSVMDHVFFLRGGQLLCVPSEFVYQGSIEPGLALEACSPLELDLSVVTQRVLIEAVDEWVSRPVYVKTPASKSVA